MVIVYAVYQAGLWLLKTKLFQLRWKDLMWIQYSALCQVSLNFPVQKKIEAFWHCESTVWLKVVGLKNLTQCSSDLYIQEADPFGPRV